MHTFSVKIHRSLTTEWKIQRTTVQGPRRRQTPELYSYSITNSTCATSKSNQTVRRAEQVSCVTPLQWPGYGLAKANPTIWDIFGKAVTNKVSPMRDTLSS